MTGSSAAAEGFVEIDAVERAGKAELDEGLTSAVKVERSGEGF
jgi:cold shock CspA family protein